jgi:hypothetical protein
MSAAVFTLVRDEHLMLPLWLSYYGRHFAPEDMYVLDHETSDGSTDGLPVTVRRVANGGLAFAHEWLRDTMQDMQRELLRRYDRVLATDVDELVFHPLGLGTYLNATERTADRCTGYHLWHRPGEGNWNQNFPLFEQRRWWVRDATYDKPLLSSVPLKWQIGFHRSYNLELTPNPALALVHLHWFDRRRCLQRHADRLNWQWNPADEAANVAWQWRLTPEQIEAYITEGQARAEPVAEWVAQQEV